MDKQKIEKTKNALSLILFSALLFFLVAPILSFAADDYVPLASIPGLLTEGSNATNLSTYLSGAFKLGIAVASVLAFLVMVYGGFTYLSTDAIMGKEEGKERIGRALGGLILAFAAYIILNTINPALVNLDLTFSGKAEKPGSSINAPSTDFSLYDRSSEAVGNVMDPEAILATLNDLDSKIKDFDTEAVAMRAREVSFREQRNEATDSITKQEFLNLEVKARTLADIKDYMRQEYTAATDFLNINTGAFNQSDLDKAQSIMSEMRNNVSAMIQERQSVGIPLTDAARVTLTLEASERQKAILIEIYLRNLENNKKTSALKKEIDSSLPEPTFY